MTLRVASTCTLFNSRAENRMASLIDVPATGMERGACSIRRASCSASAGPATMRQGTITLWYLTDDQRATIKTWTQLSSDPPAPVSPDIDGSGRVDIRDMIRLSRQMDEDIPVTRASNDGVVDMRAMYACDVATDGVINFEDAVALARHFEG